MNVALAIPEGLKQQFDELERRLWRFDSIVAACGGLGSLLLSYALIFISDRLWDTPAAVRMIFTGAGFAAFAWFAYNYGRRWVWGDRSFPALASLVQRRYRRLGDRLLGIVELADEKRRPAGFSEALCKAAIEQVAGEASKVDFTQAVGTKRPRRYFFGLVGAGVLAGVFCIVAPQAGWNAFVRWLKPGVDVERYTFVSLDNLPDPLVVPHGEPFELAVGLSVHSLLHPAEARAQFQGEAPVIAPVRSGVAKFKLAGQTQPVTLTLAAGDVKRRITVRPEYRPELKALTASVELPAYLGYPVQEVKIEAGTLSFLKGSKVSFRGEAMRKLASASVQTGGRDRKALRVDGNDFSTEPAVMGAETGQWTFAWKDVLGLDDAAPAKVRLQPKDDAPPQVTCKGMPGTIAILEDEVLHVDVKADDDFGVRDIGVRWQMGGKGDKPASDPVDHKLGDGEPQEKTLPGHFDFSPKLLGIPEDTAVAFYGTATDRLPGRAASLSEPHQIYVLSKEAHARLIQEQLEKLMAKFEEITRRQEALLDAGKEVKAQKPEQLKSDESAKKLGEQSEDQKDTANDLENLSQQIGETLKEAMRNPELSQSMLKDWAKHAEKMDELAQQSMPEASASLGAAQGDAQDRAPKLDQAIKQETDILNQMRQMQKETEKSMEKLMAQNLAARLRRVAATEKDVVNGFKEILPDVIGMMADQLPEKMRGEIKGMADQHEVSHADSNKLQDEIARMFDRTKLDRYGDVAREMENSDTDNALAHLGKQIQNNTSVVAMQAATAWAGQFEAWADRLTDKDDSKSDDDGGQGSDADMKALLALLRLREQEDELRDRTGAIEEQKTTNAHYNEDAKAAAGQQEETKKGLEALQADPTFPVPPQELAPVGSAMNDAKVLLDKPETGGTTVGAETDAINLLDRIILKQSQKSGKSGASLAKMLGTGGSGGGNLAGGDTDRKNIHIAGTRNGGASDNRHVAQAGGNAGAQLPAEFREAIESYQRAVEQEKGAP